MRYHLHYIAFTQKRKWIYIVVLILAFGIPFHALPESPGKGDGSGVQSWYRALYGATLGSDFFQHDCKPLLSTYLGGTMRLFADGLDSPSRPHPQDDEMRLNIRGKMPLGGSMHELNGKMMKVERFLAGFHEIKRFETNVGWWGGSIVVEFKDEYKHTGFPYLLENKVIGRLISIGGADWSTYGISERGFSNSLNLGYRSNRIEIAGYNYDRLYRFAEEISRRLGENARVRDLIIETPGYEEQEDELYMVYDKQRIALDGFPLAAGHAVLGELLAEKELGRYKDRYIDTDIKMHSVLADSFDLWQLRNAYIAVDGEPYKFADYMDISRRKAKNCIPRKNQEYVLRVAFNVLGSWTYTSNLIKGVTDEFNAKFPVGYRCLDTTYGWHEDGGTQYWLLLLVAVIIYFVCAILFESLTQPMVIIALIPTSLIGTFLTFHFTGIEFGTGGFASMVLLAGIVVNAGIYQMYEYRELLREKEREAGTDAIDRAAVYLAAFRIKAMPVFLTVLSTVLALLPFLFEGSEGGFWYSLAVGSMGGLLASIMAYMFVMPIMMNLGKGRIQKRQAKGSRRIMGRKDL